MTTLKAQINPLKFAQIDFPGQDGQPTADQVVDYLSDPGGNIGLPAFLERYHDIASVDDPLFVAPAEQNILQKLVWPLRHAKGLPTIFGRHLRIWENGRTGPGPGRQPVLYSRLAPIQQGGHCHG